METFVPNTLLGLLSASHVHVSHSREKQQPREESEVVGARPCSHFPAVGMLGPRLRTRNVSPDFAPTLSMEKLRPPLCCEAFLGT